MSEIKRLQRYALEWVYRSYQTLCPEEEDSGIDEERWVKAEDVAALEAENERLRFQLDLLSGERDARRKALAQRDRLAYVMRAAQRELYQRGENAAGVRAALAELEGE